MCGIVGYTGGRPAAAEIYYGLRLLEYRGYDSAGISTLNCGFDTVKKQGRVNRLECYIDGLRGCTGIGHTRWATHGAPSDINAHPHIYGRFAVAHNGIIENFSFLKQKYFAGIKFISETDSEIVPRLLDKFYDGDLLYTVRRVADMLTGSYALMIMCTDFHGFVAVKKNSPVVIGFGKDGIYAASDIPALASSCGEICLLEDGDIAVAGGGKVVVYDKNMGAAVRERRKNTAACADLDLGGYPHFMIKEIERAPAAVADTAKAFAGAKKELLKALAGADRIIITGCGTAYHSGLAARRYIEELARMPAECETAGEFRYKRPIVTPNTAVIAVSQSGETADTVEAARLVRELGGRVIAVTNAPFSGLTRIAHAVVPVEAGSEICVAATKSYTGQLAALYLVAVALAGGDTVSAAEKLTEISAVMRNTLAHMDTGALADMCVRSRGVYFLGRDIDCAVAKEGSLKLKEVSYIQSEGYPAGELKHGTLALIDGNTLSVVLMTSPRLAAKSVNAVEQILSRKGKAAVITNLGEGLALGGRAHVMEIPPCDELLSPFLTALCVQKLAYDAAVKLGRDPDKPRNLAKSVTVE